MASQMSSLVFYIRSGNVIARKGDAMTRTRTQAQVDAEKRRREAHEAVFLRLRPDIADHQAVKEMLEDVGGPKSAAALAVLIEAAKRDLRPGDANR